MPSGEQRAFGGEPSSGRTALLGAGVRWPRPSLLNTPINALAGIGPKIAAAAEAAGLCSIGDLLFRAPHSYRDHSRIGTVSELRMGGEATVIVVVESARVRKTRRRGFTLFEAVVSDATGSIEAVWFNQPWLADRAIPGARLLLHGSPERGSVKVSAHEFLGPEEIGEARRPGRRDAAPGRRPPTGIHTTGLVPVHPASERIRTQQIREWIWQALGMAFDAPETLPSCIRARRELPGIADALWGVHFPGSGAEAEAARRRLAYEELFLHQTALASIRARREERPASVQVKDPGELTARWLESLPFSPTPDQRAAFAEIDADLSSNSPMQRLLMGEVGSGKTVVAMYAMLRALESGGQAVLMAPTETLAEQHAMTMDRLLAAEPVQFGLLTGSTSAGGRKGLLARLASGELGLIVGTHALIEPGVQFAGLGVCVVDEQHRFGVDQRAALDSKGAGGRPPHVLHMTATPIPRTLSMTAFGDLDVTTLTGLPEGRRPIKTWLVGDERRDGAYEFVRERLREGRQAYIVCPLVSESESLGARAAAAEAHRLGSDEFRDFKLGLLHGQMSSAKKKSAMAEFASGRTDVLVATTVIEVGVDVPNATTMIVEGAERFGVSQLHQLRGRVGRGEHESYCILFGSDAGEMARRRLEAVASECDGFRLAEVDLALRGEGEVLGSRQSGMPVFGFASLPDDHQLLVEAREDVIDLLGREGSLNIPEMAIAIDAVKSRFGELSTEGMRA